MTVRVERTFEIPAAPERVWAFIADPANRAEAISVVEDYELHGDDRATWHLSLPIPLVDRTVAVRTRDVEYDPPNSVEFVGESKVMDVRGEHVVEPTEEGSRLHNCFVVEGRVPGVETFFRRNLDRELENLGRALEAALGTELEP